MNKIESDILNILYKEPFINQRILAKSSGYSLGKVNQSLKVLQSGSYLDTNMQLTQKAHDHIAAYRPQNAVILAAGFGMRMIPINTETPKGLLEVHDEILIERMIRHLHEAGIFDITVIVGFMKESYEYLIDKFGVTLKVNMEYASRNNLHSLSLVSDRISNTYIIPCDIWCDTNPFSTTEMYSWYMVSSLVDDESYVRVNRKEELVKTQGSGNQMVGISYISGSDAQKLTDALTLLDKDKSYDKCFWEEALFEQGKMFVMAKVVSSKNVCEINTYEQLRELDSSSNHLKADTLDIIADALHVQGNEIEDITVLKKGMTNRSFLFTCRQRKYIMRIPGEGTDQMINRREEYDVYEAIRDFHLCDDIFYINPDTGYKISSYFEHSRGCNPLDTEDVRRCMKRLRDFHELKLQVNHTFDIYGQILFYESLWSGKKSCYRDYEETKDKVFELRDFIEKQPKFWTLAHIDAIPDNFLFVPGKDTEEVRLLDWEYAGMQDSCVDIAMFAIYSMYSRDQVETLIDAYYTEGCPHSVRLKIYCYIASCGLLWSNWCEYKRQLGIEFGEYSLRQYRYAKEYYRIFQEEKQK